MAYIATLGELVPTAPERHAGKMLHADFIVLKFSRVQFWGVTLIAFESSVVVDEDAFSFLSDQ